MSQVSWPTDAEERRTANELVVVKEAQISVDELERRGSAMSNHRCSHIHVLINQPFNKLPTYLPTPLLTYLGIAWPV